MPEPQTSKTAAQSLRPEINRPPLILIWLAAIVAGSLIVFQSSSRHTQSLPDFFAFAYVPPAIASLGLATYCWMRFRRQATGYWLGMASSFFLFFILTGAQAAIEAVQPGKMLPWQPWIAARFVFAVGVISAYAAPKGLLPKGAHATRASIRAIVIVAFLCCPVWSEKLPLTFYIPAAVGLTVIDSMLLVVSGFVLIVAFARSRADLNEREYFHHIVYFWLLSLAWSAACRVFPFSASETAIAVEMTVVAAASALTCVQVIWLGAGIQGRLEGQMNLLNVSRDVLSTVVSSPEDLACSRFLSVAAGALHANRGMLVLICSDRPAAIVAAVLPDEGSPKKLGDELRLEEDRRGGFGSGPTARALKDRQTVVVDDVHSDVEFVGWRELANGAAYQVSTPVLLDGEPIGALLLWFPENVWRPWECLPIIEAMASAVAPVLARQRPEPQKRDESKHNQAA